MKNTGTLKVTTPSDREIVMTRVFDAPRELVWEAMSRPELLKRWLFGPPGWTPDGSRDTSARLKAEWQARQDAGPATDREAA